MFIYFLVALLACSAPDSDISSESVFEDVLYETLLSHDIEARDTETKVILMDRSSFLPVKANLDKIKRSKKSIVGNDPIKSELVDQLIFDQKNLDFKDLSIKGIKLKDADAIELSSDVLGVLKVSKVFFSDKDSQQGLLYYEFICGGECGSGNLVFVRLKDGKWNIIEHAPLFVM